MRRRWFDDRRRNDDRSGAGGSRTYDFHSIAKIPNFQIISSIAYNAIYLNILGFIKICA